MIAGKDKGKTGKVSRAFPLRDVVIVDGINIKKRHKRGNRSNQPGQIIDMTHPIHVSNVMLIDPKTNKPTRIGSKMENDKKVRVSRKSNATLA